MKSSPGQFLFQLAEVAVAILWSAAGSALAFCVVKRSIGLRAGRDEEREGLDLATMASAPTITEPGSAALHRPGGRLG